MSTNEPPSYPGDQPDPSDSTTSGLPTYGSVEPPAGYEPPPPSGPAGGGYGDGPGGGHISPQEPYSAPAAIGWGWRKFTQNVGAVLAAVLVMIGVSIAANLVLSLAVGSNAFSTDTSDAGTFSGLLVQLVTTVVSIVLMGAFSRASLDVADGGRFDFFGAFGRIHVVNLVLTSIVLSVLSSLAALLLLPGEPALLPVFIVYLLALSFFTYFSTWAVVDGAGPIEAIRRSVSLVAKNFGGALLLLILGILCIVLGTLALCVGLLVAWPVVVLAGGYSYRRFNGQPVAA